MDADIDDLTDLEVDIFLGLEDRENLRHCANLEPDRGFPYPCFEAHDLAASEKVLAVIQFAECPLGDDCIGSNAQFHSRQPAVLQRFCPAARQSEINTLSYEAVA